MKKLLIFKHEDWIGSPHLTEMLTRIGIPFQLVNIYQNDIIPEELTEDIAGLVFSGGTMSVNDPFKWIQKELNLIRLAQKSKLPVLGHCFGSQLISKALGGEVTPMPDKEIGWHPITFSDDKIALEWKGDLPDDMKIMIWHHEQFSIPKGATSLYTTQHCKPQAFVIGNTLATVAHVDVIKTTLEEWLDVYGYDIEPNQKSIQSIEEIETNLEDKLQEMHALSDRFYLKWLELAYPDSKEANLSKVHGKIKYYLRKGPVYAVPLSFI